MHRLCWSLIVAGSAIVLVAGLGLGEALAQGQAQPAGQPGQAIQSDAVGQWIGLGGAGLVVLLGSRLGESYLRFLERRDERDRTSKLAAAVAAYQSLRFKQTELHGWVERERLRRLTAELQVRQYELKHGSLSDDVMAAVRREAARRSHVDPDDSSQPLPDEAGPDTEGK